MSKRGADGLCRDVPGAEGGACAACRRGRRVCEPLPPGARVASAALVAHIRAGDAAEIVRAAVATAAEVKKGRKAAKAGGGGRGGGAAAPAVAQAQGLEYLLGRLVRSQERIAFMMEASDPLAALHATRRCREAMEGRGEVWDAEEALEESVKGGAQEEVRRYVFIFNKFKIFYFIFKNTLNKSAAAIFYLLSNFYKLLHIRTQSPSKIA